MSRPESASGFDWGIPIDASIGAQSLWDKLNYYRMLAGRVVAPLVGMNYDEQAELANRNAPLGTPIIPASMPTSLRTIVNTPVKDLAKDYVNAAMSKIGKGVIPSPIPATTATTYYRSRLADKSLLYHSIPVNTTNESSIAVPISGSRIMGSLDSDYNTVKEAQQALSQISGKPGFNNAYIKFHPDHGTYTVQWGDIDALERWYSKTDDYDTVGKNFGYQSEMSTNTVTTGDLMSENHHELDAATGTVRSGVSRRGFLKAVGGGALAAKALMSGAEEKIAPTIAESVLPETAAPAATTAAELGPSPLRVYERVGNKFILTHESELPIGAQAPDLSTADLDRPAAGYRRIESHDPSHPELQMLAEPGRVDHRLIQDQLEITDPDELRKLKETHTPEELNKIDAHWGNLFKTHDPYAARLLDYHKQAAEHLAGQPSIPDDILNLPVNDPRRLQWHKGHPISALGRPSDLHSYIVEKPVRIRYHQNSVDQFSSTFDENNIGAVHPEVSKLPYEHKGEIVHDDSVIDYENRIPPKLIGSGDTYDEALHKAESFLHDIGIHPKDVKVGSGKKVVRWTLPNGDVIEIRERPSLRLRSTTKE